MSFRRCLLVVAIVVLGELAPLGVYVAYATCSGLRVEETHGPLRDEVLRIVEHVRSTLSLGELRSHPIVRAYRDFYWRIGVDPTKTRPSSEALARRALRGRFPWINNVVDAGNAASVSTLVPIGIYDLDKVTGDTLRLRAARPGEVFNPIGRGPVRLKGGEPVLADDARILHLFPYRDSEDTKVASDTRRVLVVAAGVPGVPEQLVARAVEETLRLLKLGCPEASPSDIKVARPSLG